MTEQANNQPLSGPEADALLSGLIGPAPQTSPAEEPADPPSAGEVAETRARPWDFRQSTRFTPDVVRSITRVLEQSHLMIQTMLPASFRAPVIPKAMEIITLSFERYLQMPKDDGVALILNSDRLGAPILLLLDEAVTSSLLDRELGGSGVPSTMSRALSALEIEVLSLAVDNFVRVLETTFQLVVPDIRLTCDRLIASAQMENIVAPTESLLWIKQPITFGSHAGWIHVLMPYMSIEVLLPTLSRWRTGWRRQDAEEHLPSGLNPSLGIRPVRVEVLLAPINLTVGQLNGLEEGDIIVTPHKVADGFWIAVEGRAAYWGRILGKRGNRLVAQVERVIPKSHQDDGVAAADTSP